MTQTDSLILAVHCGFILRSAIMLFKLLKVKTVTFFKKKKIIIIISMHFFRLKSIFLLLVHIIAFLSADVYFINSSLHMNNCFNVRLSNTRHGQIPIFTISCIINQKILLQN